jgi:uncharacterized membrane protein
MLNNAIFLTLFILSCVFLTCIIFAFLTGYYRFDFIIVFGLIVFSFMIWMLYLLNNKVNENQENQTKQEEYNGMVKDIDKYLRNLFGIEILDPEGNPVTYP